MALAKHEWWQDVDDESRSLVVFLVCMKKTQQYDLIDNRTLLLTKPYLELLMSSVSLHCLTTALGGHWSHKDRRSVSFFFGLALRIEFSLPPSARRNSENKLQ